MGWKLNPAWKSYNDFYNEGGEGYNPHPKYLADVTRAAPTASKPATFADGSTKAVINGLPRTVADVQAMIARDERRLEVMAPDSAARRITIDEINTLRARLGLPARTEEA